MSYDKPTHMAQYGQDGRPKSVREIGVSEEDGYVDGMHWRDHLVELRACAEDELGPVLDYAINTDKNQRAELARLRESVEFWEARYTQMEGRAAELIGQRNAAIAELDLIKSAHTPDCERCKREKEFCECVSQLRRDLSAYEDGTDPRTQETPTDET